MKKIGVFKNVLFLKSFSMNNTGGESKQLYIYLKAKKVSTKTNTQSGVSVAIP